MNIGKLALGIAWAILIVTFLWAGDSTEKAGPAFAVFAALLLVLNVVGWLKDRKGRR